MTSELSPELKLACIIYSKNIIKEPIWYSKLVELTDIDKHEISKSLDVLFDWGIVESEYGESCPGKAAKLLYVSESAEGIVEELYGKYWRNNND